LSKSSIVYKNCNEKALTILVKKVVDKHLASSILKNTHAPKLNVNIFDSKMKFFDISDLLKLYREPYKFHKMPEEYSKPIPTKLFEDTENFQNDFTTLIREYVFYNRGISDLITKIIDGYKNFSNKLRDKKVEYYKDSIVHKLLSYSSPLDHYNIMRIFIHVQMRKIITETGTNFD